MKSSSNPDLISNYESLDEDVIRHHCLCIIIYFANGHFSQAGSKEKLPALGQPTQWQNYLRFPSCLHPLF
jgi:hypothetical protein